MAEVILRTEGLTKHYGGVHALQDANFELQMGEHVAIMGDNGAGKSTFVRQITGVEQRTSGKIIFNGQEVHFKGPLDAREAGRSLHIGFNSPFAADIIAGPARRLVSLAKGVPAVVGGRCARYDVDRWPRSARTSRSIGRRHPEDVPRPGRSGVGGSVLECGRTECMGGCPCYRGRDQNRCA